MLKQSLALYASEVLRGPPEYRGRFLLGKHHLEWSDAVRDNRRILALAARDHGKSIFFSLAYPLWMGTVVAPGRLGYIFSASGNLAEDHLDRIRNEIVGGGEFGTEGNPKLQFLRPFKKDRSDTIKFANDTEIRARGMTGGARGGHPFWVVADDPGVDEWIYSSTVRNRDTDYFLSAIRPMVVPGGQLIVVSTPMHQQDLYAHLERSGVYRVIRHPALHPITGEALWPERYDLDRLEETRKELGSALRFSREYLTVPISDDSSLFPGWLFDLPEVKRPYSLGNTAFWADQRMTVYMGVDLAMSANTGSDYLVVFVVAVDQHGNRWIVDIIRRKGLGYQEQVDLIVRAAKRYDAALVFVEANQYQRVISDMIARTSDIPIKAFYTTGKAGKQASTERRGIRTSISQNKNALDKGVPSLRMLLENRKYRLPWASDTRETVQAWIDEMGAMAWADGKLQGVGSHDDTVMAAWICEMACQLGQKYSVGFLDEPDEQALAKKNPFYWVDEDGVDHEPVQKGKRFVPEPETDFFGLHENGVIERDDDEVSPFAR